MLADPVLWSLFEALEAGRGLAWAAEHAATGDPVPAAWATSRDDLALWALADYAGRPGHAARCEWHQDEVVRERTCGDCAVAIRRRVPTLTIAEILLAARKEPPP